MSGLAALVLPALLLSAPTRADNAVADRVDKEHPPGVRQLLKFLDVDLIQPIFRGANAGGAARALGSADPKATAAQGGGGGFDVDAFNAKVLNLVGMGTAGPLALDLAPDRVVGKKVAAPGQPPKEVRPDSLKFVRGRRRPKDVVGRP